MSMISLNLSPARPNSCLDRSMMAEMTFSWDGFMFASCTAARISASSSFWDLALAMVARRGVGALAALEVLQAAVVAVAVKADMVPVRSAGSKGFGNRHTSPFWFNQSILTG